MDICRTLQSFLLAMAALTASLFTTYASYYPTTAKLSTNWTNVEWSIDANTTTRYPDGTFITTFLIRRIRGGGKNLLVRTAYGCGFYCKTDHLRGCPSYLFAVFIVLVNPKLNDDIIPDFGSPVVVWSANRNLPVGINATVEFAADGNLLLKDADGTLVWSTNTSGKSVARMELTNEGSLVLFDKHKKRLWQSFDHPTDTLLPGQILNVGQKLTPSVSLTNYTERSELSLSMTREGLIALMETDPPQVYSEVFFGLEANESEHALYSKFTKTALYLYTNYDMYTVDSDYHHDTYAQYLKLDSDGHLTQYEWYPDGDAGEWILDADLLTSVDIDLGDCSYPIVCGSYGICSNNKQCSCPNAGIVYFQQIDFKKPVLGCSLITQLSCEESRYQSFVERKDVYYFTFNYRHFNPDLVGVSSEKCKEACGKSCLCKAAIFQYQESASNGSCYLPSQVFSFMINDQEITGSNFTTYFKVQNVSTEVDNGDNKGAPSSSTSIPKALSKGKNKLVLFIVRSSFGAFVALLLLICFLVWRKKYARKPEENYLDRVPGMPTRFSYKDLKAASENFTTKLGEGGFGSVFRGVLPDGSKIAVKHLGGLTHIQNNSFLAEVKSIGGIHHVNLVRLVGFCAEKSHRLLVYEYVANGSLDKWIFQRSEQSTLTWHQRNKIILDIAKGLNYLHEECRQKIIHLDIKPQNILIDENFNAKVSDFGLSKLIDRNQSHVTTTMKGTRGYLAPEWLGAKISEKVDIYSFGVVILEIICGRKVIDTSFDEEEDMYLLNLFKRKMEDDTLVDMVDKHCEDMELHEAEAVTMMRIAAWCLQSDLLKRPSMSMVIKVFDRAIDLPENLEYNFLHPSCAKDGKFGATTLLSPSILSGPR